MLVEEEEEDPEELRVDGGVVWWWWWCGPAGGGLSRESPRAAALSSRWLSHSARAARSSREVAGWMRA